jgi:NagD protein
LEKSLRAEVAPRPPVEAAEIARLVRDSKIVLVDLDGCLAFGLRPHPAAQRFIEAFRDRYVILSNNSTETPESLAEVLGSHGLIVDPQRILLAGSLMIEVLAQEGEPTTLFAAPRLTEYATLRGLELAEEATVVAFARDTSLTYERLNRAVLLLRRGAQITASNPDLTHPGLGQAPVLETGALLALLRACLPVLEPRIIGKPSSLMFETALRRFGISARNAVMIGDNPDTDGVGAEEAGIMPVLIGGGRLFSSIEELLSY